MSPRFQASSTAASTVSVSTAVPYAYSSPGYSIYGPGRGPQPAPQPGQPQPGYGYYGGDNGVYCVNRAAFVKDMSRIESLMRDMQKKKRNLSNESDSLEQMAHMYSRLIAGITSTRL